MKLHPEDPRLTAFVLGELGPDEAAAVEQAIAADPALQAEVSGIRSVQEFLTERLAVTGDKLTPAQRENVRRNARSSSRPSGIISFASLQAWLIPAAAAAVLAITTYIFFTMSGEFGKTTAANKPAPVSDSPVPAPGPAPIITPPPAEAKTVVPSAVARQGAVTPADFPTLELPVSYGKSSLEVVSNSIRTDAKLPPHEAVRLEEILNNFPLRLNGVASIARSSANNWHPDNRDSGMSAHVATLSSELIACPWKPSASLLLISLRGNSQKQSDVKITFHANPQTVLRYRLLGFNPVAGVTTGPLPGNLPAGAVINLAVEIEPSASGGNLGSLEWSADGTAAPTVSLIHNKDTEPSDDARFAALVCTFSQWLAGEQTGIIDAEVVAALAREIASSNLPPDRADFLSLIDKSLHL
ncbi:MAG: hypothetical protein ABIS50_15535 [Luteolibacter sp.]|uniref:hypothetical protein n=1 Tax=Luteolibacter sp. TaxID=1962973 RepID=UPI0032668F67